MANVSPLAGKKPLPQDLITREQIRKAYFHPEGALKPIKNGTSGHRGIIGTGVSELHIAAMTQALADIREKIGTFGPSLPLFAQSRPLGPVIMGHDVREGSYLAQITAAEVFAANGMKVIIHQQNRATPTPVISHMILAANEKGKSDGVVITASHNPPEEGGYKSNGMDGGPNTKTGPIDDLANQYMQDPSKIKRMDYAKAKKQGLIVEVDLVTPYVEDLSKVVRMDVIKGGRFAATSLGGSAGGYYKAVNAIHGTKIEEVLADPDPAGVNRTYDWDGKLRGDPSSRYVMMAVQGMREKLGVPFIGANDNDADRFGGEDSTGILNPNHILCVLFDYLAKNRNFDPRMGVGRTIGTTHMLDAIAKTYGRQVKEVDVGFKYYVKGLIERKYVLAGEESAGLSLPRLDGTTWVTEKDGIAAVLLMMEVIASTGKDIGTLYGELTAKYGPYQYERIDTEAAPEKKKKLQELAKNPDEVRSLLSGKKVAGKNIDRMVIGDGVKVVLEGGIWVLKRASGTEDIIKDYREERGDSLENARKASEELDKLLGLAV